MISQYFNIPLHTLNVSLRDGDVGPESNLWMAEDALGPLSKDRAVDNDTTFKNILIVDDINDTGATINWILNDWPSGCLPDDERWGNEIWNQNVKFATIFDNLASESKVKMDYVGEEINKAENPVWIEFPFEEWWTK
jgi:hypoxanthine phosphoribosyltransferase